MKNNSTSRNKTLTIGWLYPELMNIYGDIGNIICLRKRCEWRNINVVIKKLDPGFSDNELKKCNLLVMGGAQDKQQLIVNNDLIKHKKTLTEMIKSGVAGLFVCGGFQFLGNYYKDSNAKIIKGLEIFNLYTESGSKNSPRLIGDIVIEADLGEEKLSTIVGFENHGGRTYLQNGLNPFGKVIKGHGNNDQGFEGARYINWFGTYLHGPILPKNPGFADYLIKLALNINSLEKIDDKLENKAQFLIAKKLGVNL